MTSLCADLTPLRIGAAVAVLMPGCAKINAFPADVQRDKRLGPYLAADRMNSSVPIS